MSNILNETYARFEDRFRGSRELILDRLRVYMPLLAQDRSDDTVPTAIDYGCGRGEWLAILKEAGWNGIGVDTNVAMLAIAAAHGLHVERADALAHLARIPDGSVQLVSAFHLVEHLPIETLLLFIREALRVLRPDGTLILETPNPENLLVGTCTFYLDPTHQRPLPPALLHFLVEDAGAGVARVVRLNGEPPATAHDGSVVSAIRPMFTTGLDYAVIGSRSSDPGVVEIIDTFIAAASQPNPIDLARIEAIDALHRLERAATARSIESAVTSTNEMLASQGSHLQATTDRVDREMNQIRTEMTDEFTREEATRQGALARILTTIEASQATTDRTAREMDRLRTQMTDEFERQETTRQNGLAQMLDILEGRLTPLEGALSMLERKLTPLALLPQLGREIKQLNEYLAESAGRPHSRERELEAQLQSAHATLRDQTRQLAEKLQRETNLAEYVEALHASRSWRVTRPLRTLSDLRKKLGRSQVAEELPGIVAQQRLTGPSSTDKTTLLMIDPDPDAVAAWQAMLSPTKSKDLPHATLD